MLEKLKDGIDLLYALLLLGRARSEQEALYGHTLLQVLHLFDTKLRFGLIDQIFTFLNADAQKLRQGVQAALQGDGVGQEILDGVYSILAKRPDMVPVDPLAG